MENIHGLDKKRGLDLILHTPGGDLTATEQTQVVKIVENNIGGCYIRSSDITPPVTMP